MNLEASRGPGASVLLVMTLVLLRPASAAPTDEPAANEGPTVGRSQVIRQQVLPGSELEVRPLNERRDPLIVRIVEVYRHGTDFRYDLEFYGLEPGQFDLRTYLRRKDGSSTAGLPPLPVTVRPALPPGQILPHPIETTGAPHTGGYHLILSLGCVLWVTGAVVLWLRGRRRDARLGAARQPRQSLADRLRPLVESAAAGTLRPEQRAELERLLLGSWSRRLGLEAEHPSQALAAIQKHPEAGRLLEQLEIWLHRPGTSESIDLAALLEPYRHLAPEGSESVGVAGGSPTP